MRSPGPDFTMAEAAALRDHLGALIKASDDYERAL